MACSVVVFALLLCIACARVLSCSCNTSTVRDALAALHRSTNGATWLRSDMWLQPGSSVCDWYGVVWCSSLELGSNNLTGTLPAELSLLAATSFVALNFSVNGISGTIPPQLALLSQLSSVRIDHNRLHGTLPPELASWSQLTRFLLNDNNFFGTLPPEYANWTAIQTVEFFGNNISGTLPPEYSAWSALTWFAIERNQLTGTLPPEYAAWRSVMLARFYSNRLTGTLPVSYSNLMAVEALEFFDNNISGTLPPEFSAWSALTWFTIERNQLTGTLPPEYAAWRDVRVLRMDDNMLTGTLPAPYLNWTAIQHLQLSDNNLSGTLPPEYAAWSALRFFGVDGNQLTGTLPPEYAAWSAVTWFGVDRNLLTGTLPPEYSVWSAITQMSLRSNRLSGTIPAAYGALRPDMLLLDDNMLSGTVPTLRVSNVLTLQNNRQVRGTLPFEMGHTLVVVLCNTSVCGAYPPMWAAGFTRLVCSAVDPTASRETLRAELLTASLYVLPRCPMPHPRTSSSAPTLADTRSVVTVGSTIGGIGAALSGSTAMHVSLRTAVYATRVTKCSESDSATGINVSELGILVVDNPTRLSIPGPLPLTSGTVVGNLLLLVAVPLMCAAACAVASCITRRAGTVADVVSWPATSLLLVWGFVQVPTAAASVSLAIEAARAASTAGGVVCAVGCTLGGGAVALAIACWLRVRRCRGRQKSVPHRTMDTLGNMKALHAVWGYFMKPRSVWYGPALSTAGSFAANRSCSYNNIVVAVVRCVCNVLQAASVLLLRGCHYPHTWVIVYDIVGALLSGALIGVASTPHVSCRAVQAAAWAIAGVACVQAAVAVMVLPRSTVADCAFDAVMCIWTAVGALFAALGIEEGSEESAIVQGAVALLYGLPAVAFRCRRTWSASNAAKHRRVEIDKRCKPVDCRRVRSRKWSAKDVVLPDVDDFLRMLSTVRRQEVLRRLVAHACCFPDVRGRPLFLSSTLQQPSTSQNLRQMS